MSNDIPVDPNTAIDDVEILSDEEVNALVDKMVVLANRKDFEKGNGLAALVVNFGLKGNFEAWRNKGKKHPTIKKIVAHARLPVTPIEMYRSLGAYEIWMRFGRLEQHPNVTPTHLRCLIGLLPDEQKYWLDKIQVQCLSTRDLEAALSAARDPTVRNEVADALAQVRTAIRQLGQITDEQDGLVADLRRAGVDSKLIDPVDQTLDTLNEQVRVLRAGLAEYTSSRKRS